MWNLRSQSLKNWYLGQQLYLRVYDADPNPAKERPPPDNLLLCGKCFVLNIYIFFLVFVMYFYSKLTMFYLFIYYLFTGAFGPLAPPPPPLPRPPSPPAPANPSPSQASSTQITWYTKKF